MSSLYPKDGVPDLVLLSTVSNDEIVTNLKKRFARDVIYSYIGSVLISVNPFKEIRGLYSESEIFKYRNRYIYENPPSIFAIAEECLSQLMEYNEDHCVIISGESGAGKTEASKKIMQYIAAVTGAGDEIQRVKDAIIMSNPVLEAFGNAKTVRNNNSSRFGKYMEIYFDYKGDPIGGKIQNYLLEKVRVVSPAMNERSFHIMYQLMAGKFDKGDFGLSSPDRFNYLAQSQCFRVDNVDDSADFDDTLEGMRGVGMNQEEIKCIMKLVAAVLWIGNVEYTGTDKVTVSDPSVPQFIAKLLECDLKLLESSFVSRTFSAPQGKEILTPLGDSAARFTRDSLAKTIYNRLFDYVVARVNDALAIRDNDGYGGGGNGKPKSKARSLGVLDIYGFEIFEQNSLEQMHINFVNEKLQQIFIEKVLQSEQQLYISEGLNWVKVDYFDNKIVCDLIEKKNQGIFAFLDEECLLGQATDKTYLEKLERNFSEHKHFVRPQMKGNHASQDFIIRHYAGDVRYNVEMNAGFLEKNRDLLFKDLLLVGESSRNPVMKILFPQGGAANMGKARPPTACTTFKSQVNQLMEDLGKCQPHYIRTIKPNHQKRSGLFDDELCLHQVKYLGLLENLRVRKGGYCYREEFHRFLKRYKMLCASTWPHWESSDLRRGCEEILTAVQYSNQNQYVLGKTRVFIRQPISLFTLEELRERKLHDLATLIQKVYRSYKARKYFLEMREKSLGIFGKNKQRRRGSVKRYFIGDWVSISGNPIVEKHLQKSGDKGILFADNVDKINKAFKVQPRIIILSDKGIYNIGLAKSYKLNRRIAVSSLTKVSLSTLSDNLFVLHVLNEYDYIFVCEHKTEFITALADQYILLTGKTLQIDFVNNILVTTKSKKTQTLYFTQDLNNPVTTFVPEKEVSLKVMVGKTEVVDTNFLAALQPVKMTKGTTKPSKVKPNNVMLGGPSGKGNANSGNTSPSSGNGGYGSAASKGIVSGSRGPNSLSTPKSHDIWAKGIDDFKASDDRELSFNRGDVIRILSQEENGWWSGDLNGKLGYVPSTYLEICAPPAGAGHIRKLSRQNPAPKPFGNKGY